MLAASGRRPAVNTLREAHRLSQRFVPIIPQPHPIQMWCVKCGWFVTLASSVVLSEVSSFGIVEDTLGGGAHACSSTGNPLIRASEITGPGADHLQILISHRAVCARGMHACSVRGEVFSTRWPCGRAILQLKVQTARASAHPACPSRPRFVDEPIHQR